MMRKQRAIRESLDKGIRLGLRDLQHHCGIKRRRECNCAYSISGDRNVRRTVYTAEKSWKMGLSTIGERVLEESTYLQ